MFFPARLVVFAFVVLLCCRAAYDKPTSPRTIPVVQPLHIVTIPSGPVIHGLFNRFPYIVTSSGCAVAPRHYLAANLVKATVPVLNPSNNCIAWKSTPGCEVPECPLLTQPDYFFGCHSPSKSQAGSHCVYNQTCINWTCVDATSGSCIRCIWTSTGCAGCYTRGSCRPA